MEVLTIFSYFRGVKRSGTRTGTSKQNNSTTGTGHETGKQNNKKTDTKDIV